MMVVDCGTGCLPLVGGSLHPYPPNIRGVDRTRAPVAHLFASLA